MPGQTRVPIAFLEGCRQLGREASIPSEVLAREQILLLGEGHHFVEEFDDCMVFDQSLAILREDRGHPHLVIHCQADEPAKKQVILNLLHQLPLRADAVEDLDQHGSQQLLGRDARPPALRVRFIHPGEQSIHLRQRFVRISCFGRWLAITPVRKATNCSLVYVARFCR